MSSRALPLTLTLPLVLMACGAAPDAATTARDAAADRTADVGLDLAPLDDVALDDVTRDVTADASADAPADVRYVPDAEPVSAPNDTWTWVDVPGSACANGRPTGFGINRHAGARGVMIFLQGGGACWDGATCWGPVASSFYVATGYGRAEFALDILRPASLLLRRNDAANPFRDFNLVYVPYCTGDVHAGDRVATYDYFGARETHHRGARNLTLLLPRVAATFPDTDRVFVAGDSAGGFGVAFSVDKVQAVFPQVRVAGLDDSGPPIQPDGDRWATWARNWGVVFPPECSPACATSIDAVVDAYRVRIADNPIAVMSFENDFIIRTFMGYDAQGFGTRLRALADRIDRTWPGAKYFITPGISHVLEIQPIRPQGYDDWVRRFVAGDTTLRSVRP